MTDKKDEIELRSDDVEDILGKVPGWITRNGMLMLFIVILVLLVGSWLFKIPEVKQAKIYVTSLRPPADIESRTNGKVEHLLVSDNEKVGEGKVLAVIENPADFEDVIRLKEILKQVELPADTLPEIAFPVNGDAELGTIQPDYATFFKNYRQYREFLELDYHQRKIELMRKEYDQYVEYTSFLDDQASTLREEYKLAERQYLRDSTLFTQGVVSESNFETTKSQMLVKRASWQEMISLKAENEIKIARINDQLLELELKQQEQETAIAVSLGESFNKLTAALASWEKNFLIIAPIDGVVTFNSIWSEHQNVRQGEKVMTIVPDNEVGMIGKIRLPMRGAGEVSIGDPVHIRFENYPHQKYGMVKGEVSNVSKVPQDDFYNVEVTLPEGLNTYYNITLEFRQNMQGDAEIITDEMRLLQRIFNPVRSTISRQREM